MKTRRNSKNKTHGKSKNAKKCNDKNLDGEVKDSEKNVSNIQKGRDNGEIYIIEKIIGHKKTKNGYSFKIKWRGYNDITWIRQEDFSDPTYPEKYLAELKEKEENKSTDSNGSVQLLGLTNLPCYIFQGLSILAVKAVDNDYLFLLDVEGQKMWIKYQEFAAEAGDSLLTFVLDHIHRVNVTSHLFDKTEDSESYQI